MWIALVVIASGAITFAGLMARSTPRASAVAPGGSASRSPGVAKPADAPRQRWSSEHRARWTSGDRSSVAFDLPAENPVQIWTRRVRPMLVVRCLPGRIDAFVFTESPIALEAQSEDHTVTYSLDGGATRSERWPDSMDHDALFAPDGAAFAAALARASTLRFGYTPHNAAPVTTEFAVAGIGELLDSAAKPCGRAPR
jgi:hypothetical protein